MTRKKSSPRTDAPLRARAEKLLAAQGAQLEEISMKDVQKLVHELQVHQIQLEMQNQELRQAQVEIEESRTNYEDLFDFAPLGYSTFDQQGLILEVNLTGAGLLGVEQSSLINSRFALFLAPESRPVFYEHLRQVLASSTRQTCELQLVTREGGSIHVDLESRAVVNRRDGLRECRSIIIDITARKQVEEGRLRV